MSFNNSGVAPQMKGSDANGIRKYKIGKVKQTPTVRTDPNTGLSFIQLKPRSEEKVYGCTKFLNHYKEEQKLGQGTFGEVYKGVHLETQRQVAMKRIIVSGEKDLFPITAQREITILKKLNHKNVLKLIEMVYDGPPPVNNTGKDVLDTSKAPIKHFYMILPYMVADLSGVLHNPRIHLQMADIKNILLQMLEGLNYIHCLKYMHRDIKTANILIDHNGIVKIADFGLARLYYGPPPNLRYPGGAGSGAKYTSVVVTRWYRAPELVLGDKMYTTAVDIWGVGCVFGEFFEKKPILQGASDIDQGHAIFKLLGTPTNENWELAKYLPGKELTTTSYNSSLKERFGAHLNDTGLNLMSKLLELDPLKRYTAMSAKLDPFFTEEPLPSKTLRLPCEESHEADIKRYKEELHQAMSQKAPTAPQGHRNEAYSNPHSARSKDPLTRTTPKQPNRRPPSGPQLKNLPAGPAASTALPPLRKLVDPKESAVPPSRYSGAKKPTTEPRYNDNKHFTKTSAHNTKYMHHNGHGFGRYNEMSGTDVNVQGQSYSDGRVFNRYTGDVGVGGTVPAPGSRYNGAVQARVSNFRHAGITSTGPSDHANASHSNSSRYQSSSGPNQPGKKLEISSGGPYSFGSQNHKRHTIQPQNQYLERNEEVYSFGSNATDPQSNSFGSNGKGKQKEERGENQSDQNIADLY
ncbi:cyclin-dependent serine/threonine protein kinase SGV1 KNAG_0F03730 [Huiozyma naganishii CBS 8797]|uniref:Serine/threonine-protein kinase BUR1 n=1 Tax=Huiozyma naganishii (strain ATCC MYA-139 / BCRC 22969 / CBS 8797 / KCTC 17520 / NBRC 10181 / NCYC 3082 / Yp74L-3) TaxID=1071383 RepID=J7R855_HUIN7|nr:hypothetical protein KNAG_0F03730 [Kazachstania naganishii CBS 8797]CCK71035.1 hypothetical protein KNAG_0F03730 [Kazachstania naganishii CBS 8797]